MKYAYLPFPNDAQLTEMTEDVVRSFHRGKLSFFQEQFDQTLLYGNGPTPVLKKIRNNQQLYIFAHGTTGAGAIIDSAGNRLPVKDLAEQLVTDGLSMAHKVIKLWACQGGAGPSSTALQFKNALRTAGFNNVTVYGYTQDLWSATKGPLASKQAGDADDFEDAVRAKDVRVKF